MTILITVIHVIVCLFLILVVLLQAGKGGGMGVAFGAGGGGSVFGGSGAGNFLTRLTVISAFLFMVTSMSLAYFASSSGVDPLKQLSAKSREAAAQKTAFEQSLLGGDAGVAAPAEAEGAAPAEAEGAASDDETLETTPAATPGDDAKSEASAPTDGELGTADKPANDKPATGANAAGQE
jgi:preprotein translocase subunit SecG